MRIDEDVMDAYADTARAMVERYYGRISRYATSPFMRLKLGEALTR